MLEFLFQPDAPTCNRAVTELLAASFKCLSRLVEIGFMKLRRTGLDLESATLLFEACQGVPTLLCRVLLPGD